MRMLRNSLQGPALSTKVEDEQKTRYIPKKKQDE